MMEWRRELSVPSLPEVVRGDSPMESPKNPQVSSGMSGAGMVAAASPLEGLLGAITLSDNSMLVPSLGLIEKDEVPVSKRAEECALLREEVIRLQGRIDQPERDNKSVYELLEARTKVAALSPSSGEKEAPLKKKRSRAARRRGMTSGSELSDVIAVPERDQPSLGRNSGEAMEHSMWRGA